MTNRFAIGTPFGARNRIWRRATLRAASSLDVGDCKPCSGAADPANRRLRSTAAKRAVTGRRRATLSRGCRAALRRCARRGQLVSCPGHTSVFEHAAPSAQVGAAFSARQQYWPPRVLGGRLQSWGPTCAHCKLGIWHWPPAATHSAGPVSLEEDVLPVARATSTTNAIALQTKPTRRRMRFSFAECVPGGSPAFRAQTVPTRRPNGRSSAPLLARYRQDAPSLRSHQVLAQDAAREDVARDAGRAASAACESGLDTGDRGGARCDRGAVTG